MVWIAPERSAQDREGELVLPRDLDPLFPRLEIRLGTDGFHTQEALLAAATEACEANA